MKKYKKNILLNKKTNILLIKNQGQLASPWRRPKKWTRN